jgi:hypothetical protein
MAMNVMKLLDPGTGLMECKVCGATHLANIRPQSGGQFYRGSWQCQNGCSLERDALEGQEVPASCS